MSQDSIKQRLLEPEATFTAKEMYHAFEALAEIYGYYRSPELPPKEQVVEITSLTLEKYAKFGVLVVRPRTMRDTLITIPSLIDKILGNDFTPSQNTSFNASLIALAKTVIVSPVGIVEQILNSTDENDLEFFLDFAVHYAEWMRQRTDEATKKNSGKTNLNESASSSETNETFSPPTPAGLI